MHKGIIVPCTCQCFHIGSENELMSSAVIFALKYPLITRDPSCDWEQIRRECFQFTSFRQELKNKYCNNESKQNYTIFKMRS